MIDREFLGWDRPFLLQAVDWLLTHKKQLPHFVVVVPTSQSGRRLRESLAEKAGALLAPKIVTPGSFLRLDDPRIAPDWMEQVAWVEILENVTDWTPLSGLFPEPPEAEGEWAAGLASDLTGLRRTLQENGLLLATASRRLQETTEADRWAALARLEQHVESLLATWGFKSRSSILSEGLPAPQDVTRIILAGVPEAAPLVERAWENWPLQVTALVGAPASEADTFSSSGCPLVTWNDRPMPWPDHPHGSVTVTADPRQQAADALKIVRETSTPAAELALGSPDAEVGAELARAFTRGGWPAFHPAAQPVTSGLSRWMAVWSRWIASPTLAVMADLLGMPETGPLLNGKRSQKARTLADLRNQWIAQHPDDLRHRLPTAVFRHEWQKTAAQELLAAAESLESWRASFLQGDFISTFERLMATVARCGVETRDAGDEMTAWLHAAAPIIQRLHRNPRFWIDVMLSHLPQPTPVPADGRVVDVQGWLELFHEPGRHLLLCGVNEGKVPARSGGEPWLTEPLRERLGLITDARRAARDAWLFQAMVEARRHGGRVDILCGKSGTGGEALLPSRILLAAHRDDLPERVKQLFKEVEPPDAGMRWEADWKWQPRTLAPPTRIAVTTLRDYLACPFRYYLKNVVRMQRPESDRAEWNARDYGTLVHEVLENWGNDLAARELADAAALSDWFADELDRLIARDYGARPPLAMRIQAASIRARLTAVASVQAAQHNAGWRILSIEQSLEIPIGETIIRAKVDRIDRHCETGALRVLDYKTGKAKPPEAAHRSRVTHGTRLPEHFTMDDPVIHEGLVKGKSAHFRWTNLQLPLYAHAILQTEKVLPTPCYFAVDGVLSNIALDEWQGFEEADAEAAFACTEWVVQRIAAKAFWPPAERITHDDFTLLATGRSLAEMVSPDFLG